MDGLWSKSDCKPAENLSGSECDARDRQKDTRAENEIRVHLAALGLAYPSRSEKAIKSQFQSSQNCLNMSAFKIPNRWRAF